MIAPGNLMALRCSLGFWYQIRTNLEGGTGSVTCKIYKNKTNKTVKIIPSNFSNRLVYQGNESISRHQDCIELNLCQIGRTREACPYENRTLTTDVSALPLKLFFRTSIEYYIIKHETKISKDARTHF